MTNNNTGWFSQVVAQGNSLPEALEAAVARCSFGSHANRLVLFYSAAAQQPRASTSCERNMGVPDMLLFQPRAFQLRPRSRISHTHTAMSRLRNKAADCTCCQSSHSGHVESTSPWPASERCEEWNPSSSSFGFYNIAIGMPSLHLPEPSFSPQLRDLRCIPDNGRRQALGYASGAHQVPISRPNTLVAIAVRHHRMHQAIFPCWWGAYILRTPKECTGAAQMAPSKCPANS